MIAVFLIMLALTIPTFIMSIVLIKRTSTSKKQIDKVLECFKELTGIMKDGMSTVDTTLCAMKCSINSMERDSGEVRAKIDDLQTSMKTALKGVNKNTKNVLQALIDAVAKNDAVMLSQVVRSAKILNENFNEVESAFDDSSLPSVQQYLGSYKPLTTSNDLVEYLGIRSVFNTGSSDLRGNALSSSI